MIFYHIFQLWLGRTAQQQYDEKVRLQKCCAQYMTKFVGLFSIDFVFFSCRIDFFCSTVGRLERLVSDLVLPNEDELLYTISGLKQVKKMILLFSKRSK